MIPARKRLAFYRAALMIVQADAGNTLCFALLKVSGRPIGDFPEVRDRKPPNRSATVGLWWDKDPRGQAERIRVLREAISEIGGRGL